MYTNLIVRRRYKISPSLEIVPSDLKVYSVALCLARIQELATDTYFVLT